MLIRRFQAEDQLGVLQLFDENTPIYFDSSEREDLKAYLKEKIEDYFVVEEHEVILAAGGINYDKSLHRAIISWDMVSPKIQGKGIGQKLTQYRLQYIKKDPDIKEIIVRTAQNTFMFYEKMGFTLQKIVKDYWAKGYDLYLMSMTLGN